MVENQQLKFEDFKLKYFKIEIRMLEIWNFKIENFEILILKKEFELIKSESLFIRN